MIKEFQDFNFAAQSKITEINMTNNNLIFCTQRGDKRGAQTEITVSMFKVYSS